MTLGWAPVRARKHLDDAITDAPFMQWHTGDPGAAGTANVATNTTRVDTTGKFAAAGTAGASTTKATNASVTVTSTPAAEDYTHVSFWTLGAAGVFTASGLVTANPVAIGDNLVFASGAIALTQPNAN